MRIAARRMRLQSVPASLVLAIAVGLLPGVVSASGSRALTTFNDPAGDATNGAPDLTTIEVTDSSGRVTWVTRLPGLPATETYVELHIDADRNPDTGSRGGVAQPGSEYALILNGENLARDWWRWDAGRWNLISAASMFSEYRNDTWTARVSSTDMNNVRSFNFRVYTWRFRDDRVYGRDESGPFTYTIGQQQPPPTPDPPEPTPPNRLALRNVSRTPERPTAGESFTISARVVRLGRPGRFMGIVYCDARVDGKRLRWFGSVQPARAACRWDVPESAAGKQLVGFLGVSEGGPITRYRVRLRVLDRRVELSNAGVTIAPAGGPEAGREFYYAMSVIVAENGRRRPIETGSVTCGARVGSRTLRPFTQRVRPGNDVLCGWNIPTGTSGRTLNGLVTVRSEGSTLRQPFTRRIR